MPSKRPQKGKAISSRAASEDAPPQVTLSTSTSRTPLPQARPSSIPGEQPTTALSRAGASFIVLTEEDDHPRPMPSQQQHQVPVNAAEGDPAQRRLPTAEELRAQLEEPLARLDELEKSSTGAIADLLAYLQSLDETAGDLVDVFEHLSMLKDILEDVEGLREGVGEMKLLREAIGRVCRGELLRDGLLRDSVGEQARRGDGESSRGNE